MSEDPSSSQQKKKILLPVDVTPDHVLGLVEALNSLGGSIDSMYVGDAIFERVDILPKAIDVAEALGLIRSEQGNLTLTDLGKRVARSDPKSLKYLLKNAIARTEPLTELVTILKHRRKIGVEEFESIVEKYYPGRVEEAKKNLLIWGAFLNLFKMDEDDEEIHLI
ncbi:AAA-associated domain-containing protein [Infirmifilum lucidum]|uniref:AAA-associated domain-containing protein n=1 Tax=Infirmifilum lucidum TaxID=2776706 RepID=A0A7L9FFT2_9CREN|nr:AAA-associated domain-containing protein [Infirmifilum lucidum]QOJ78599.1 AAA-associated domain-containing protein [Infirmifilum lucidum]